MLNFLRNLKIYIEQMHFRIESLKKRIKGFSDYEEFDKGLLYCQIKLSLV